MAIYFCIGDVQKSMKFINKKLELPDINAGILAFTEGHFDIKGGRFRREGYVPIIWLPSIPESPMELATLSHEIFHAICDVFLRWTSIPLTSESEETYCHLIGYVTRKFCENIK